jgi:hypothetical protein
MNKTETARDYLNKNEIKKCLAIVKGFKIGITKEESGIITRGYECLIRPQFYKQIGFDPAQETKKAIILARRVLQ